MWWWILAAVVAVVLFALAWWSSGRAKGTPGHATAEGDTDIGWVTNQALINRVGSGGAGGV